MAPIDRESTCSSSLQRRRPDFEARRLLWQLSTARVFGLPRQSVERLRRNSRLSAKAFASRERVAKVEAREVAVGNRTLPLRIYTPDRLLGESRRPSLLWIHGGGFVLGDLHTADATCRKLANHGGCIVIAVGYRLAPEASLHHALEDCLDAFCWLRANAADLGLDPGRIAVGGDSAGGTLAALVAQRCRSPKERSPVAQVLVYPATDLSASFAKNRVAEARTWLLTDLFQWLQARLPGSDLHHPHLSPARARELDGLPPTIMVTAGFDPLRDQALDYARRLSASGVAVRLLHLPGQFHGFLNFDAVLHGAEIAFAHIGEALAEAFAGRRLETRARCRKVSCPRSWGWLWLRPSQRLRELEVTLLLAGAAIRDAGTRLVRGRASAGPGRPMNSTRRRSKLVETR